MTFTINRLRTWMPLPAVLLSAVALGPVSPATAAGTAKSNEPVGACCYKDPHNNPVCDMVTAHVCGDYQGTWYGPNVPCTDPDVSCGNATSDLGACCADLTGSGLTCTQVSPSECDAIGGIWFGAGVPCSDPVVDCPTSDPTGACCYPDADGTLVCEELIQEFCIDRGGYWYGPGTVCTDPQVECPPLDDKGACCYKSADNLWTCMEMSQDDCDLLGGAYYGSGVLCTDPVVICTNEPITGACCYEDSDLGQICDVLEPELCLDVNGIYFGNGTLCSDPSVDCGGGNDPVPGACCYDDPDHGFVCVQMIEEFCLDAGGYWYGAGTLCTDPQVECDPIVSGCTITGGAECAGRPSYLDPAFSQVFGSGAVAIETASPSIFGGSMVTVFDLTSIDTAPLDSWFALNRYSDPDWNQNVLGSVFGLAVNERGDIFVTSTKSWSTDWAGFGGWGAVYRLDAITGDVTVFATLPNTTAGLGSITWDCDHQVFFVSNMEDGLIYRLDASGTILDTFDPAAAWTGAAGPVALGDRPWAVEVHANRLYFSMWNENCYSGTSAVANEIWSVELDASGMPVGTEVLEISLPDFNATNWSSPVSDIRFSPRGTMLLAERSMTSFETLGAHVSRVLEYECENGAWIPSVNQYAIGVGGGTNATGGVDADLQRTWASADALHLNNPAPYSNIYGFTGLPNTGGSNADSVLVDYQDQLGIQDKTMLGDLVVTAPETAPCLNTTFFGATCHLHHYNGAYHRLNFGFSGMGSIAIDEIQITGPAGISFGPATLVGPFPPYQSYPVNVNMFGATSGQPLCLEITAIYADGSECTNEMCFDPPACAEPWPGDVTYDQKVDITDLLAVIADWGQVCDDDEDCTTDLDGDGAVGIEDLLLVLEHWSND